MWICPSMGSTGGHGEHLYFWFKMAHCIRFSRPIFYFLKVSYVVVRSLTLEGWSVGQGRSDNVLIWFCCSGVFGPYVVFMIANSSVLLREAVGSFFSPEAGFSSFPLVSGVFFSHTCYLGTALSLRAFIISSQNILLKSQRVFIYVPCVVDSRNLYFFLHFYAEASPIDFYLMV